MDFRLISEFQTFGFGFWLFDRIFLVPRLDIWNCSSANQALTSNCWILHWSWYPYKIPSSKVYQHSNLDNWKRNNFSCVSLKSLLCLFRVLVTIVKVISVFSFLFFFFFHVTLSHHFGEMGVSHAEIEECWWAWHDSVYRATLSDCFQSDGCVPHAETGEIEECRWALHDSVCNATLRSLTLAEG